MKEYKFTESELIQYVAEAMSYQSSFHEDGHNLAWENLKQEYKDDYIVNATVYVTCPYNNDKESR